MGLLTREDLIGLKSAGYTEHELAEITGVATPTLVKLARLGIQPQIPITGVDVADLLAKKAALKAVKAESETVKADEIVEEKVEKPSSKEKK